MPGASREVGDRWGTGWALINLALALLNLAERGEADVHVADAVLAESEAIWNELGERRHLAFTYMYQAQAAILQGNLDVARQLLDLSLATLMDLECWRHDYLTLD